MHRHSQLWCSPALIKVGIIVHTLGFGAGTSHLRALEEQAVSLGVPFGQMGPNADSGKVQSRRGLSRAGLRVPSWLQVPVEARQVKAGYN